MIEGLIGNVGKSIIFPNLLIIVYSVIYCPSKFEFLLVEQNTLKQL